MNVSPRAVILFQFVFLAALQGSVILWITNMIHTSQTDLWKLGVGKHEKEIQALTNKLIKWMNDIYRPCQSIKRSLWQPCRSKCESFHSFLPTWAAIHTYLITRCILTVLAINADGSVTNLYADRSVWYRRLCMCFCGSEHSWSSRQP